MRGLAAAILSNWGEGERIPRAHLPFIHDFTKGSAFAYNVGSCPSGRPAGIGLVGDAVPMRRIISLFRREPTPVRPWSLTAEQHRQVLDLLSEIGLGIVAESRGPVPLLTFGKRVLERLHEQSAPQPVPLPHFADALKRVIRDM